MSFLIFFYLVIIIITKLPRWRKKGHQILVNLRGLKAKAKRAPSVRYKPRRLLLPLPIASAGAGDSLSFPLDVDGQWDAATLVASTPLAPDRQISRRFRRSLLVRLRWSPHFLPF